MYNEREYTSKSGRNCVESSVYGRCEVISKEEAKEEQKYNECFFKCENIKESRYNYYVDEEIIIYYAVLK